MNSNIHLNFSLNCWEALRVFKTTAIRKEKPRFENLKNWVISSEAAFIRENVQRLTVSHGVDRKRDRNREIPS